MAVHFTDPTVISAADRVVLYGAGQIGRDVLRVLRYRGTRVECFLDQRVRGACDGVDVYPASACPVPREERQSVPIILSMFNRDVDVVTLASELRAQGFSQVVNFVGFHHLCAKELGNRFWLTDRRWLESQKGDIQAASGIWADTESLDVYAALIELRRTGEYAQPSIPRADRTSYFNPGIPGWLEGRRHRFVDCGAYRGDTLELLLDSPIAVEASAHFEPDLENFTHLAQTLAAHRNRLGGPAMAWPCAVAERSATVGFDGGQREASSISRVGESLATAVALDDALVNWRPTFVKMDIEGSEIEALNGAGRMLSDSRPCLAICVYHRPDHLWRIPIILSHCAGLDGYEFYLRAHGHSGFDTVLYARPASGAEPGRQTREVSL